MRKHLLPATAEGDTIFLEHKSENKGLCCSRCILQSTNLYDIYHFFLGALAVLLSAQPRPWACGMHKPQPLTGIQMRSLGSLGLGSASIFNPIFYSFYGHTTFLSTICLPDWASRFSHWARGEGTHGNRYDDQHVSCAAALAKDDQNSSHSQRLNTCAPKMDRSNTKGVFKISRIWRVWIGQDLILILLLKWL